MHTSPAPEFCLHPVFFILHLSSIICASRLTLKLSLLLLLIISILPFGVLQISNFLYKNIQGLNIGTQTRFWTFFHVQVAEIVNTMGTLYIKQRRKKNEMMSSY